ncbi:MAG: hypothetical protein HOW97_02525 [Catenulispora sp.]|nr:hypothetical protein [Catenulispora sp.]
MSSEAAVEACRQLRELTADGYPVNWLARQTHTAPSTLYAIRAGQRQFIHWTVAEVIDDAYRTLHGTDPTTRGLTHGAIGTALLTAGRNGWTSTREEVTT